MNLPVEARQDLRRAKLLLENPSLAARITALIGTPIEKGFGLLPERWAGSVHKATRLALEKALRIAVTTLGQGSSRFASDRLHQVFVAAAGGAGGAVGLPALFVELPLSTAIMLRSIAAIAGRQGEAIRRPEAQLACLQIFALGGASPQDNAAETGYFALRAALAHNLSQAAQLIAERGLSQSGAPAIVRFLNQIASRFGVAVTEKAAAQALPVVGAAGGALINTVFLDHFQDMAHGHFIIRRLEREYGSEVVRRAYEALQTVS